MATAADIVRANLDVNEYKFALNENRKQTDSLQNRRNKMGIGRLLGMGAGLLGAGALSLGPLGLAFGAALGSRLGNELGQRSSKIDQVELGKLNRLKAAELRRQGIQAQRDLNRSANVQMLTDGFSAYVGGQNLLDKFGEVKNIPGKIRTALSERAMAAPPSIGITEGSNMFMNPTMPPTFNPLEQAMNTTGTDLTTKATIPQSVEPENVMPRSINDVLNMDIPMQSTAIDNTRVATNPLSMDNNSGGIPFSRFTGTSQQNRMLADAMGLNTNRSIVDQLKRYGGDSSFDARQNLFNQYFGY